MANSVVASNAPRGALLGGVPATVVQAEQRSDLDAAHRAAIVREIFEGNARGARRARLDARAGSRPSATWAGRLSERTRRRAGRRRGPDDHGRRDRLRPRRPYASTGPRNAATDVSATCSSSTATPSSRGCGASAPGWTRRRTPRSRGRSSPARGGTVQRRQRRLRGLARDHARDQRPRAARDQLALRQHLRSTASGRTPSARCAHDRRTRSSSRSWRS